MNKFPTFWKSHWKYRAGISEKISNRIPVHISRCTFERTSGEMPDWRNPEDILKGFPGEIAVKPFSETSRETVEGIPSKK